MNELTKLTNELDPVEQRGLLHAWLADHPSPAARQLADAGLIAPDWPRPWGLGADPHLQLVITEELAAADVAVPDSAIGMG
ncbi:MAG: acyl-CoA dehydrogenase, partial [Candidatus Microthrix parvicella]